MSDEFEDMMDGVKDIIMKGTSRLSGDHDTRDVLCALSTYAARCFGASVQDCEEREFKGIVTSLLKTLQHQLIHGYSGKELIFKNCEVEVREGMSDSDIMAQFPEDLPEEMKQEVLESVKKDVEERAKAKEENVCH